MSIASRKNNPYDGDCGRAQPHTGVQMKLKPFPTPWDDRTSVMEYPDR